MNSSAQLTAISFLAAAALGAAVFGGCTTTSGIVDDTDGGTPSDRTPVDNDSGSQPDASQDAGPKCESKQDGILGSEKCQSCLAASCCTELQGCFSIAADADAGKVDCNEYATCINECGTKPEAERDACYEDCDLTAADNVANAYNAIVNCKDKNCTTACE